MKKLGILCVLAALAPAYAADRTISANYTLSADETVDGILTVASGVTVDLNGHSLTVGGLAGNGTITAGAADLTSPDTTGEHVSYTVGAGGFYGGTTAANLFNDNYQRVTDSSHRVILTCANLPLAVTYDFGADSPKVVNMYKIYCGIYGNNAHWRRSPKAWTFEGSNDNSNWTQLDLRDSETNWSQKQETRTYTFANTTAYRYYRITFTSSSVSDYFELVQLEYFNTLDVPATPSELHVNVPANASRTNSTVTITGNVRLVKEGAGEFVAAKSGQMYTDGNEVAEGTLKTTFGTSQPFGAFGCEMSVENGATFDFNGSDGCHMYPFVVDGGTVANTGTNLGNNASMLSTLTLTDDSDIFLPSEGNVRGPGNLATSVNLNGHLLDVTNAVTFRLVNADVSEGAIRVTGRDGVIIFNGVRAPSTSFDLSGEFGAFLEPNSGDSASVSNLTLRSDCRATSRSDSTGVTSVYGRFKTETTTFTFVKMMGGSTLDLTAWQGTFDTASTSANVNNYKMTFEVGATVTVDVAGRTFALGDCIVAWDEMPQNVSFQFDATTASGGVAPVVTERGIFYGYLANAVEWAWWTGAANDGDLTNPANWICKNAGGEVLSGSLPIGTTRVFLEGSLNIQVPASGALTCGKCVLTNCTLAVDCDLRGLGTKLQVAESAEVDLNGHRLYIPAVAFTDACTVRGREIGHDDDLTTTDAACVSSPTTFNVSGMKASNLFNNNYSRSTSGNTKRVIVAAAKLPLIVTYDFGEAKVVDAYRIWTGPINSYANRLPKAWAFEGSNDNVNWTLLDARHTDAAWKATNMYRTYTFANTTAYRYYRITITENNGPDSATASYLELVQLEYFHLKPTQGELHIDTTGVADGFELSGLALHGNMRLFVEGNGFVRLTKTGQTYLGGTELLGGTVGFGAVGAISLLDTALFGPAGTEIVVRGNGSGSASAASAILGIAQKFGYSGYKFVLAGGTIQDTSGGAVMELRLETNSYMKATSAILAGETAWLGPTNTAYTGYADLGGHELSVTVQSGRKFGLSNATLENGYLNIKSGGWFTTTNSVVATNNVLLRVNCAPDIGGTFTVRDYIQPNTSKDYNMGDHDVDVYGTFKTGSDGVFHGTTLHDGATIDLCDLTGPLNVLAPFNTNKATAKGVRTLHFEPGATLGVKLGGRKVPADTAVISWTAANKPADTVKFKSADIGSKVNFMVKDDGLYVVPAGFMVIFR